MAVNQAPTPHIQAQNGEIAETILLPGDPLRAEFIAKTFLTNPVKFNEVRNMLGYTGEYNGKKVSVMGTGMGNASIGIYSYELIHYYGVKNLIRIGTAGAMQEKVRVKDLVLGMACCTNSNYLEQFELPGTYAPTCSFELLDKAVAQIRQHNFSFHVGNILSSDTFYNANVEGSKRWRKMGLLAVEMESAALYSNAAYAGVNALTLLTISDSSITGESLSSQERQTSFTDMMKVALEIV